METVRGLSAAQCARDMDSGPDPFSYAPGTVFCDDCGYRVPKDDCVRLDGRTICSDCLLPEIYSMKKALVDCTDDELFEEIRRRVEE